MPTSPDRRDNSPAEPPGRTRPLRRNLPPWLPTVAGTLGGLAVGFVLGVVVIAGGTYAAGYRLVDRDTAKTVEALRAWAKDPETDRKMREATERLNKATKNLDEFGRSLKKEKAPTIPSPP